MVVGNLNASEGCEVLVIGAGPGGYLCAIRLAQLGKDVILVDKRASLGGVCLNEGCIPSKAIIHAAELLEQTKHASEMGLVFNDEPTIDMKQLQAWKSKVVTRLTGGVKQLEKAHGVRIMQGTATFTDNHNVELANDEDDRTINIQFDHAVIATGTSAIELPPVPFDGDWVIGSREALEQDTLPQRLVVIGGGYIGLELGTAYRKLGSEVSIVELQDDLLGGRLEPEIHRLVRRRAKALGIDLWLKHKAVSAKPGEGGTPGIVKIVDEEGKESELLADKVLVVIGRRPNTSGIGLENIGISLDEHNCIPVDEYRRTKVPNIFAIGDITGQPMLAHKAYREAKVAAEVIAGHPAAYDVRVVPAVMFTDPEVATVGLTEAEAKEAGYEVITGNFPLKASGRALTLGGPDGFAKFVADKETQRLLGVHLAGPHVAELIAEGALAIELDAFLDDIANTIHPHPTLSEALLEAAELALGTCAHFKK
ncbi:MAG TPA: dihydrolipoyl dehydrogenase [Myxococcales bacterium]|nr:dihydrolipoyl dehydrogenase [Deltaproteobacteria bacterium]HAA53877.1 dihydrolipoyl dehydrogenase [Myxococcales bacterium]|tara:strand:- start:3727 stop:5169 length:1443 start_codon:yes stop_codon:yes gene_type:complete